MFAMRLYNYLYAGLITLPPSTNRIPPGELQKAVLHHTDSLLGGVRIGNPLRESEKEGDCLELLTATVLLHLGVRMIRRSMRIQPAGPSIDGKRASLENEFDLLFNHNGRIWVVDCKDRKKPENFTHAFQGVLKRLGNDALNDSQGRILWARIKAEISSTPKKVMKEDILAARDLGGLLGQVICLRKSMPSDEIQQFALSKKIHIVIKNQIVSGLQEIPGLF